MLWGDNMAKKKKKRDGGVIRGWQLHHLTFTKEQIESIHPGLAGKPLIFTGTVKIDHSGRFKPGTHMRSSLIVRMDQVLGKLSEGIYLVETLNTFYVLEGPGNSDVLPDLGNGVLSIFY